MWGKPSLTPLNAIAVGQLDYLLKYKQSLIWRTLKVIGMVFTCNLRLIAHARARNLFLRSSFNRVKERFILKVCLLKLRANKQVGP